MTFGPGKLRPNHRQIIKRHLTEVRKFIDGDIEWSSKNFAPLKNSLRISLRKQQQGRCVYCRRKISIERRNTAEDIEHYLDKSKAQYRKWAFSPVNLAIACHPCNMQKSTKDMGDAEVALALSLTASSGDFRWIHPYFDDYFENIEIVESWIYVVKANAPQAERAKNMIKDCKLDQIQTIESGKKTVLDRIAKVQQLALKCFDNNRDRSRKLMEYALILTREGWKHI
ncbi:hypothetical protein ABGT18_05075 [Pseudomonas putida]|uniref:hypothetical protein n=1 Tax=Pseudomonas putida TaxID=303 RepID=UPI00345CF398